MDLCADGKQYYVGIMEYQEDGVVYDFIDNDELLEVTPKSLRIRKKILDGTERYRAKRNAANAAKS